MGKVIVSNNKKKVIVVGAGGHAKVVIDTLKLMNREILGLIDSSKELHGKTVLDIPVIGDDSELEKVSPIDVEIVCGIASTGLPTVRKKVIEKIKKSDFTFAKVIHPSAVISSSAILSEGVQVMAGAIIQADTKIYTNSIINTSSCVEHDCIIGNYVHIAPKSIIAGYSKIGDISHVGLGARVLQNIILGDETVVGAGSTVTKSFSKGKITLIGTPAKEKQ